jgi:phenylpyruvate tautomerase PptA (4-oxalocrotonate tautomerase family)
VPQIQIDVQPLTDDQRSALRERTARAVTAAIGSPTEYVNVVIRESAPSHLVEAGESGTYQDRGLISGEARA